MKKQARTQEEYYQWESSLDSPRKAVHIFREKALRILNHFNVQRKPLKFLDVGCEDGSFSLRAVKFGYEPYGLEIAQEAARKAKSRGVKVVVGNAEKGFPFKPGFFDAAYAGDIIEHLYDTDFFIGEFRRVLKPGGLLVITTPNLASLSNRIRLLFGKLPIGSEIRLGRGNAGHIRNYTFPELERQLREHGFEVVRKVSSNLIFPVKYNVPLLKAIAIWLGDYVTNIGSHIIVGAIKKS